MVVREHRAHFGFESSGRRATVRMRAAHGARLERRLGLGNLRHALGKVEHVACWTSDVKFVSMLSFD